VRYPRPLGLLYIPAPAGEKLARLAGLEGLTRAVMVGTIPLAAFDALGSKEAVSYAFFAGSALTLAVTVNVGRIERVVPRRWVLTGGVVSVFVAAYLFAFGPGWTIPLAIGLRTTHASVFSVCLSLYMMDFIGKADLTRAESRRSIYIAAAWLTGPALGTWLWTEVGSATPFLAAMALAVALIAYHWHLRLEQNPVLLGPITPAPSPLVTVPRFFRQKNLRIAYAITCIRSTFWATVFVYGPIYVVEAGLPTWVAGGFLSATSAVLFLAPVVERASHRYGVRACITSGFGLMATSLVALTLIGDAEPIGLGFWLLGAVGGGIIDVLGNIPFMRLVRPKQRAAMASVFATWREVSFLLTPGLAAVVLAFGPFWVLYAVLAVLVTAGAVVTSYLPRRLGLEDRSSPTAEASLARR
jgi:ACDE family multidrug resistance protein